MPLAIPNPIEPLTPADAVEIDQNYRVIQSYVNADLIRRDGGVAMIGPLTLGGPPTQDLHAATKAYVDSFLPVGIIMPFGGQTAPAGQWMLCDGTQLAQASFPELYSAIGLHFNPTAPIGSFNLPDLRGRIPIGAEPGTRFAGAGGKGGTWLVPVPAHTHGIDHDHAEFNSGNNSVKHTHTMSHQHTINHDHGQINTGSAGGHAHEPSTGDGFYAYSTGGPSGDTESIINATAATMDARGAGSTNTVPAHVHTVNLPSYTGKSGWPEPNVSGLDSVNHTHPVNVPEFIGASKEYKLEVTIDDDANPVVVSSTEHIPPYLILNYIIRVS